MSVFRRATGLLVLLATGLFIVVPFLTTSYYLIADPGLRSASPSRLAIDLHRSLSRKIPDYVAQRIASGKAATLGPSQIEATEWPVYGAFFYLLATENLHRSWAAGDFPNIRDPAVTGGRAIEASVRIMLDEGHAHWVREYWGDDYLTEPNCFYRMLLIGSLTAHHNLTGDATHLPLLRRIVDDLAGDIDRSPHGLIDDYPGQCFPADVAVAIAMVRHADTALGGDRRQWARDAISRMLSNFGDGLPPYTARASSGQALSPSRGCTNGFFFGSVRGIDPTLIDPLYDRYVRRFWKDGALAAGWREFPANPTSPAAEYYIDPDSGPVVGGFGTSATGLGLGAARRHGDARRAGRLGTELIATAYPFPGAHLFLPSLVGNRGHAPHFPEIVLLHQLSISSPGPELGIADIPVIVWLILAAELLAAIALLRLGRMIQRPGKAAKKTGR